MDVRLDPDDLEAVDLLAQARGHDTRSAVVRELIREAARAADLAPEHPRLEHDDVMCALERRIRGGNLQAMRMWLEERDREAEQRERELRERERDPFADFDPPPDRLAEIVARSAARRNGHE